MIGDLAAGVWEFVAGEDWRVALGIALALGATALLAAAGLPAWWLTPVATLVVLHRSVKRQSTSSALPPPRRRMKSR